MEIHVLQGEREMATDNKSLGRFILDGIPAAPRGVPQIEVTFDIDSNGILNVTAKDKTSGKEQKITIQNSTNLSDEEVEKMKADAEKHAEDDKAKKDLIESRNKANSVAFEIEKQLKEYGDKLDAADKSKIEEDVKKRKELAAKEESSKEEIEKAIEATFASAQKIGEAMQKANASQAQPSENPEGENAEKKGDKDAEEGEVVKD
ncbi:Chaperone protein dnaK2 [bioreactor metagenome]|uniref:Chaperone protein dnaK2 n=1 Tax=bioreactor metagenome TaxID=1076179 RepID=A0A645D9D0_9ZZZZ